MNFGQLAETTQNINSQGGYQWSDLELTAGVDKGVWDELVNLRLKIDGQYVFWKSRGGTRQAKSIAGNVLQAYPFSARVGGVLSDYIAMQTSMGNIELWNVDSGTVNQIMTGFPTTEKVQIIHRGIFIYAFSYDGGVAKYYDMSNDTAYDYLSYNNSYIYGANFFNESFEEDNILGFEVGSNIIVFPNEDGLPNFQSYQTVINNIKPEAGGTRIYYKNPNEEDGGKRSTILGGISADNQDAHDLVFPYSEDTEELVGLPSNKEKSSGNIVPNENYEPPIIYRQYVIVDILNDGSATISGKPYQVQVGTDELLNTGVTHVTLNVTAAGTNVAQRLLCATRWHDKPEGAFAPSTPDYPNSPLFIVREIRPQAQIVTDNTPDRSLQRVANEILPQSAGIPDLFASGQIIPNSIASFRGSLLFAGYTVNRPLPKPYDTPTAATDENIYVNITPTSPLPSNMSLSFQFEYTDGKRSSIVDTPHVLQAGSTSETQPVACEQNPATAQHTVTGGAQDDASISFTYDGIQIEIPLTVASHSSPSEVAAAISQAVENSDVRLSTELVSADSIKYTENRYGEQFNGKQITIEPIPIAAVGHVDVTANSLQVAAAEGYLDVTANNLASGGNEPHQITIGAETTNAITINDTDTLEQIVDKYVTEINSGGNITTGWTASKVDNGDGTWRCLITSDTSDEADNGTTISVDNVDVAVTEQNAQGGNDGEESHTITVGATTTTAFTVLASDTLQDIAQKYVDAINGNATISGSWTAALVDNGDGTWRCEITSDTTGTADNGTTVSVSKSDTVSGGSQVSTTSQNSEGGSDGPLLTFDTRNPLMAGAQEPDAPKAKGSIYVTSNNVGAYPSYVTAYIGGNQANAFQVAYEDSKDAIIGMLKTALENDADISNDWSFTLGTYESYEMVYVGGDTGDPNAITDYDFQWVDRNYLQIEAKQGGTAWNGIEFGVLEGSDVSWQFQAPGKETRTDKNFTAGGDEGCLQATASLVANSNGLGSGATEQHTITVDGVQTDPIDIDDTMSVNDIALAWQQAIQSKKLIDESWQTTVNGGELTLTYRIYGSLGNDKAVSITGNSSVATTVNSPSSGGDDAGEVPSGTATLVNANRMQIHSLSSLVTKIYILGTTDGGTSYHLIREVGIESADAHGKMIDLPNAQEQLDEIENTNFPIPSTEEILETVEFESYVVIGTPYQQFNISGQKEIVDQSRILRAMPLDFDVDKTQMRYKIALFTDDNIQFGYLTEGSSAQGQFYEADFEVVYNNIVLQNRKGISLIKNIIPFQDTNGIFFLSTRGELNKIIDINRFPVLQSNEVQDTVFHRSENEYWFICKSNDIVVFDTDTKSYSIMRMGSSKSVYSGLFGHGKLYLGMNNGIYETDVDGLVEDYDELVTPDPIQCVATTTHLGDESGKSTLKELLIAGQNFNVGVDIDLQKGRKETGGATWSQSFAADKSFANKTLKMYGENYQLNAQAPMPRLRMAFNAVTDGFISNIRLKSKATENAGKPRE